MKVTISSQVYQLNKQFDEEGTLTQMPQNVTSCDMNNTS